VDWRPSPASPVRDIRTKAQPRSPNVAPVAEPPADNAAGPIRAGGGSALTGARQVLTGSNSARDI
jgi:hypothetical protein